jgi:hypothetical protein
VDVSEEFPFLVKKLPPYYDRGGMASSLYRSRGNYSTTWLEGSGPAEANAIVPAYYPGSDTQRQCNSCIAAVVRDGTLCHATATAVVAAICAGSGWFTFGISCAVAVGGLGVAFLGCDAAWGSALAYCSAEECCPKRCGGVPNHSTRDTAAAIRTNRVAHRSHLRRRLQ